MSITIAALLTLPLVAAPALAATAEPAALQASAASASHAHRAAIPGRPVALALDRRMALLAAELKLSAAQQVEVKAVLLRQREQVQQVWSDDALPAAVRIGRTQAISDHTADQIRALLDEEQRKKYIQPRQRDALVGTSGANVESWLNTGVPK